ncbi:arginine-glutamic acid dipeptide repeats protein isoform X3 [Hippoglossus stenolepis]|uniref:arginine-glutamic acid dipeptide repeats protein isoform X3 n=1 Tax=Hippoglossus stenolepis TaxID=195615 RepID=UPI00159C1060|nr:arginine-glutamic acid dipeptide repeats protein isoform X3 [Hippoglossus stenolepis]
MDQEDTLDFKALRARFQDEELLLTQPRIKPTLPEKPKQVPPPQSPPGHLPAGARPSLLTSINQSLEGKTHISPRVVFKDEKKEGKMSLIKNYTKLKVGKDKTKGSKEKLDDDSSEQKPKKDNAKDKRLSLRFPAAQKESTEILVPATPPPKGTIQKKKGFLGFMKSVKKDSLDITTDPILDSPSSDILGTAPLIPVPSEFGGAPPEPEIYAPKALLPNIPSLPASSATMETAPPFIIPASPDYNLSPAHIPDFPDPSVPTLQSETPLEIETPVLSVPHTISPTPPTPTPPPVAFTPSPSPPEAEISEAAIEAVSIAAVETPPLITDPPSTQSSPKLERPISALSALERAADMSSGKRTPADQRILNALENARKKSGSPQTDHNTSYSITPPPEDLSPSPSPTFSLLDLPPIDYEDRAGNALRPKPEQVNGIDHRQASSVLEGVSEEGSDVVPELFVVPPPPPRKVLPDPESLGPAPEKPDRPPYVHLSELIPLPPAEDNDVSATLEFSETDTTDIPEFDDVSSVGHSPELPVSGWENGEYTGPDTLDGQNLPDYYSNGITAPAAEVDAAPALGDEYQNNAQPVAGLEAAEAANGISAENTYEDVTTSAFKKKGKSEGGKKRKGPPKNPYTEAAQETNGEKGRMSRFGKTDKKAAVEGSEEKELKKREKQRLEKEKKEFKEKQEREKKEQKEREKKENEMKKKFKIAGQEDAMYQATVTVTTKGRKDDLPVKSGDIISIIRTTNCPKGKWLARDSSNTYGYIAVDHVELDIKEMLELGKRAAITRNTSTNVVDGEVPSAGSRASNHYPLSAGSFSDDSEEWTGDEDETLSPVHEPADPFAPVGHTRTLSMPDLVNKDLNVVHQHSHSDISAEGSHVQARPEALQKFATISHSPKPVEPASSNNEVDTSGVLVKQEAVALPDASETAEVAFDPDSLILPPPDLYADLTGE